MIIDLRTLAESRGRLEGVDRVEFTDAFGEDAEVACGVEVGYNQAAGAYYFHVRLAGVFDTQCHRCLDPVACPLESEFDLVVRRGAQPSGGEAEGEDYITIGANDHEVPLHPRIHENIVVAIPMLILCSEECRGLCPQCGANRNREECACAAAGDPRWGALRKPSED